jgi:hypothetical protein
VWKIAVHSREESDSTVWNSAVHSREETDSTVWKSAVHSREETDSIVWKSAVHSRSDTTLGSEEAVDPWADEQRNLQRRATVCVLRGPATQ